MGGLAPSSPPDRPPGPAYISPPLSRSSSEQLVPSPQSVLSAAAVTPPQIRRSSRPRKPGASLFPGINWLGVKPLPPSPNQSAASWEQPLVTLCPHGVPFPSATLLPVCCTQLTDESSPDVSPSLPDHISPLSRSPPPPLIYSPPLSPNTPSSSPIRRIQPIAPNHLCFRDI